MNKTQVLDVIERFLWTAVQVVGADAIVSFMGWDIKWIVPVAALLAGIKGILATKFGNGTASSLPAVVEPLQPAPAPDGAHVITDVPVIDPPAPVGDPTIPPIEGQ